MLRQKLLKAPARMLLLTLLVSARMTVASSAARIQFSNAPAHAGHTAVIVKSRARQKIDYSQIEGIQRWGLNE